MKKLACLLCGLGTMFSLSVFAQDNGTSVAQSQEPQYQEQCVPVPCIPDTVCNQLPCNVPDNAPCVSPVPADQPAPCAVPINSNQTTPEGTQAPATPVATYNCGC